MLVRSGAGMGHRFLVHKAMRVHGEVAESKGGKMREREQNGWSSETVCLLLHALPTPYPTLSLPHTPLSSYPTSHPLHIPFPTFFLFLYNIRSQKEQKDPAHQLQSQSRKPPSNRHYTPHLKTLYQNINCQGSQEVLSLCHQGSNPFSKIPFISIEGKTSVNPVSH